MSQQTPQQTRFKAQIFHALSASDRLEILDYLRTGEKCVCEIIPHLSLIQPMVSRHLKILKDSGLIRCRKEGTKRLYSLVDNRVLDTVDALNSELVEVLQKEVIAQMTCSPENE